MRRIPPDPPELEGYDRFVYPSGVVRYTPKHLRPKPGLQWSVIHWLLIVAVTLFVAYLTRGMH